MTMRKVLIIARLYQDAGVRIARLAEYLPQFGWQPLLLSPPLPEKSNLQFTVIETPYRDALAFWKRLLRYDPNQGQDLREQVKKRLGIKSNRSLVDFAFALGNEIFAYPDTEKGWKPFALKAASELLHQEDIGAMLSSSSPVTTTFSR